MQVRELKARNGLSSQDKDVIEFVHSMEIMFSQPSFAVSKRKLEETANKCVMLAVIYSFIVSFIHSLFL